jgi:uncharacterized protein (DUF1697 family)
MTRRVAFLRAINVGGHTVTMDTLRTHFRALGFADVETFIASGNVLFDAPAGSESALARRIEARLEQALGYEVHTFLRTGAELARLAAQAPFPAARMRAARVRYVGFLAEPLGAAAVKALKGLRTPHDELVARGREIHWLTTAAPGEATITNAVLEKALKVRTTVRGVNTVERLVKKYGFTAD